MASTEPPAATWARLNSTMHDLKTEIDRRDLDLLLLRERLGIQEETPEFDELMKPSTEYWNKFDTEYEALWEQLKVVGPLIPERKLIKMIRKSCNGECGLEHCRGEEFSDMMQMMGYMMMTGGQLPDDDWFENEEEEEDEEENMIKAEEMVKVKVEDEDEEDVLTLSQQEIDKEDYEGRVKRVKLEEHF